MQTYSVSSDNVNNRVSRLKTLLTTSRRFWMMSSENGCAPSSLWISASKGRRCLMVRMMYQTPVLLMMILMTVQLLHQVWPFLNPCLASVEDIWDLTSEDDNVTVRLAGGTESELGAILIFSGECESNRMRDRRNTTPDSDNGSKVPLHPW